MQKVPQATLDVTRDLYKKGMACREIADTMNLHYETVRRYLTLLAHTGEIIYVPHAQQRYRPTRVEAIGALKHLAESETFTKLLAAQVFDLDQCHEYRACLLKAVDDMRELEKQRRCVSKPITPKPAPVLSNPLPPPMVPTRTPLCRCQRRKRPFVRDDRQTAFPF